MSTPGHRAPRGGGWSQARRRQALRAIDRVAPGEAAARIRDQRRSLLVWRLKNYFLMAACAAFILGLAFLQCVAHR